MISREKEQFYRKNVQLFGIFVAQEVEVYFSFSMVGKKNKLQ